jgi:hypothetical protein
MMMRTVMMTTNSINNMDQESPSLDWNQEVENHLLVQNSPYHQLDTEFGTLKTTETHFSSG